MKNNLLSAAIGAAVLAVGASAASATTLSDVKAKGFVQFGVNTGLAEVDVEAGPIAGSVRCG
ncbi:hypothetical protein AB9F45_38510, partial [Rhizobium leguminosarum]